MKKLLILLAVPVLMGSAGFFGGKMLNGSSSVLGLEPVTVAEKKVPLFKLPLGKFTVQVDRPTQSLHLLFDIDLYLAGSSNFEKLNGANGRAIFRDATVLAVSEMAENALWMDIKNIDKLEKRFLAEQVVRALHPDLPMVRTARVNRMIFSVSDRTQ